jgi:hypothetical protein
MREVPRPPVKWPMREKEVRTVEFERRCKMYKAPDPVPPPLSACLGAPTARSAAARATP